MVRASGGLSARQRAWAQQQGTQPVAGARRRAQRQVLVTWLYHRRRATEVAARWAPGVQVDDVAVDDAQRTLALATRRLLGAWGERAPTATGRTMRQLRDLARQASPSR